MDAEIPILAIQEIVMREICSSDHYSIIEDIHLLMMHAQHFS